MSEFVTDTHALLWHLSSDPLLSTTAHAAFALADAGQNEIYIPSIVLVEFIYLSERQRVPGETIDHILQLFEADGSHYHIVPLTQAVVAALRHIPRDSIPDMPDRIIAATALYLRLPLITRDSKIKSSGLVNCHW